MHAGEQISCYELLRRLHEGKRAEVWEARDRRTDRLVAIKFLGNSDPQTQDWLRLAFEVQARLKHPNINTALEFVQEQGNSFLVMQYFEQGSLEDFMAEHPGPMQPNQAIELVQQVLLALDYAHRFGYIHREVKPSNILLDADSRPYITDFGTSSTIGAPSRWIGTIGTPAYISPEQIRPPEQVSFQSDIYSVGVLLYRMLTGHLPFGASEGEGDHSDFILKYKHLHEVPRPVRESNPQVSRRLEAAVLRALRKEPSQRFASAQEMREALLEELDVVHLPFWKEVSRRTSATFADAAILTFGTMFVTVALLFVISAARKYLF